MAKAAMLKDSVWQIWNGVPHLFQTTPGVASTALGRRELCRGRGALSCCARLRARSHCKLLCNRRRATHGAFKRGMWAIARSLNVGSGQTASLLKISAQRRDPALLVVTTRRPISVPGAVDSRIANRDELATAAVAERAPLEFDAGCLYVAFWRPFSAFHKSSCFEARKCCTVAVSVLTDALTCNTPETQL